MNKYNHWIAKTVRFFNPSWKECAITFGQTTYFTCDESEVSLEWHAHEDKHKEQWRKDGWFLFLTKYIYWSLRYGYANNPYELEAEEAARQIDNV